MGDDDYTPSPYFSHISGVARSSSSRPIHKLSVKLVDTYKRINTVCILLTNFNYFYYHDAKLYTYDRNEYIYMYKLLNI